MAAGLHPDPLGELKRSPRPLSRKTGGLLLRGGEGREGKGKGGEGRGKEGKGREGKGGRGREGGEGKGEGGARAQGARNEAPRELEHGEVVSPFPQRKGLERGCGSFNLKGRVFGGFRGIRRNSYKHSTDYETDK